MTQTTFQGLTSAEVAERVRQGQVNHSRRSHWTDYADILRRNLITLFNLMVVPAAVALFWLHEVQGGIAVSGMAVVNTVLGLVQEIRAKRHLDRLAILVETHARALRDGQPQEIPASDIVLGDHILLQTGEAVVADGAVLEAHFLEVDEALLTGESDPVRAAGDTLLSGSYCVAGEGLYRADRVGAEAFAQSTSSQARRYSYADSPLTRVINVLIKILSATAVVLTGLYFLLDRLLGFSDKELVKMIAATITSMVPQGLVLTATVSFTLGAVVMSRRGAIVQRLNAVEAMAAIDVICTDKTGTLTTNHLCLAELRNLTDDLSDEAVRQRLAAFASASVDRQNKNIQALRAALGAVKVELLDQIPFKSQNRYSAVRVREDQVERVLILGAPEALLSRLQIADCRLQIESQATEWQRQGLRTMLFAELAVVPSFNLQSPLRPLALIALSDELRPEAGQVLQALTAQGISFKVISGDNAETVRATVSHLDLPLAREPVVSGAELVSALNRDELILTRSVFGRVTPQQKVEIVESLKRQGRLVAMIGDGVNDVLPIKRSDLGIAMGEGTQAAKTVAGLVLENNNFALLPETLEEGRTIIRNLRRSAKLFLVKNVYSLLLILAFASGQLGLPFPYVPQQVTLLNWLVIGIPAFVIALTRERSTAATRPRFLRDVGWFAVRTGVLFALAGLTILWLSVHVWGYEEKAQRTLLLSVLILLGITALLRALHDGESQPLVGDSRVRWLAGAAVPVYLVAMYWPFSARFFELTPLTGSQWLPVLVVAGVTWGLTLLSDQLGRGEKV